MKIQSAVQFHDHLNPKLWEGDTMIPVVRYKLLKIADNFIKMINVPSLKLRDIIVTGSNAAYSYTKSSDIDLHLLVDIGDNQLRVELYNAKKEVWNKAHKVTIRNLPIEVYVQDVNEHNFSNGIYSVLDDRWLVKPKKIAASIDDTGVKTKYNTFVDLIKTAIESYNLDEMRDIRARIKKMRQTGLDDHGEFGPENIAFKLLRNRGWIGRLMRKSRELEDRELSLEHVVENIVNYILDSKTLVESIQNKEDLRQQARKFVTFARDQLAINKLPKIKFVTTRKNHVGMPSFGHFSPGNEEIVVATDGRHIMDVFRTLAHELVHWRQFINNELTETSGVTGSDHENEANAFAGVIMRNFAKNNPNFFNKESR